MLLHFAHLREDARLLRLRERAIAKSKGGEDIEMEKVDLAKRRMALKNQLIENLANLPLTIHW